MESYEDHLGFAQRSKSLNFLSLAGHSADQVVSCLSRDSYGTGVFLQELMSVLSLQQQPPPTETSDQDFYSQFTDIGSGDHQGFPSSFSHKGNVM